MISSIEQLIEEVKRRVSIIQSEPQTMARELMIENLSIGLDKYEEITTKPIAIANAKVGSLLAFIIIKNKITILKTGL
jgi:hypothetical protein